MLLAHCHANCINAFVDHYSICFFKVYIYIHAGSENSQETSQSQLKEEFDKSRKSLMSALTFIQKKQVDEEKEEVASLKSTIYMYTVDTTTMSTLNLIYRCCWVR
jgi:hypothetical protein